MERDVAWCHRMRVSAPLPIEAKDITIRLTIVLRTVQVSRCECKHEYEDLVSRCDTYMVLGYSILTLELLQVFSSSRGPNNKQNLEL